MKSIRSLFKLPVQYRNLALMTVSALLLSSCFVSGPVHFYAGDRLPAEETARILVPGPITVKKIDGEDITVPSIEDGYYEIYVLPGLHRVEFRYELYWGDNTSGSMVTTEKEAFETVFNAGKTYTIVYKEPTSEDEALWLQGRITARLVESDTQRTIQSHDIHFLNRTGITSEINAAP